MNLRQLEVFINVYENKSFTKASQKMHIAQPSISLAIKELETELGVCLFNRSKKMIVPTSFANRLYYYANKVLSLTNEMKALVSEVHKVRIGSSMTISTTILPQLVKEMKSAYSDLEYQVVVDNCEVIEQMVLNQQLDFALIENEPHSKQVVKIPFLKDQLVTIVSGDHPLAQQKNITLETLTHYPFLAREVGSSVREIVQSIFAIHQVPFSYALESASTQAIIEFVKNGLGVATLPYRLVQKEIENECVKQIKVKELDLSRNYHLIYFKTKYQSSFINELIQVVLKR